MNITTIDYLYSKAIGRESAKYAIKNLLDLFSCAEVTQRVLKAAIDSDFSDFEDAVLYQAGLYVNADGFVTRNINDFVSAESPNL